MMKKLIFILISLCCIQNTFAQEGNQLNISKSAPTIDGNIADWEFGWEEDGKLAYTICQHEDIFYIRLKPLDETTERKIIMFGLTLMLDGTGKKEGEFGITFPTSNEERMMEFRQNRQRGGQGSGSGPPSEEDRVKRQLEIKQKLVETSKEFIISGLTDTPIKGNIDNENSGIELALGLDENNMVVYEAKIPKGIIKIKEKKKGNELAIGFETGFLDVEAMRSRMAQGGGRPPGGGGGQGNPEGGQGGRRSQGGGGGNRMNVEELSVPTTAWEIIKLD